MRRGLEEAKNGHHKTAFVRNKHRVFFLSPHFLPTLSSSRYAPHLITNLTGEHPFITPANFHDGTLCNLRSIALRPTKGVTRQCALGPRV